MRDTNQLFITFHYESSDKAKSLSSPFPSSPGSLKPGIDLLLYDIKQNGQKNPTLKYMQFLLHLFLPKNQLSLHG